MGCGCKNAESGCGCGSKEMNWESYDKPKYKTMMADGGSIYDGMAMPLIISMDTSGSTMLKYKEGVFDFDTINAQYRKVAISAISNLSPSEVVIFDHNRTVEQVFKGSADDAVQFIRDKDNLQPRNGTARMSAVLKKVSDLFGNKLILTDGQFSSNKAMMAEEPAVQEPDWIPQGDGRAIGQQDFAINLSPLHAESRFDKLSKEIADEYEEKGMSPEKAQEVGDATAAKIGRAKYGKTGMVKMQKKGMKADMVGNPSPMFNEDITGQDGPSAEPTNAVFEAMRTLAPSSRDVESARRDLKNSGYGDVIYDRYMVNRDGSSNKFYYTAVTEKDGKYYPMGAYGRIGYLSKLFNIYGKKENPRASMGSFEQAYRQCRGKENAKIKRNYVDFTLQMAESFGSETLAEIEGPTAEATTGGLHSPSSFTIGWEDGAGYSSASLPPNEIAWAEDVKGSEGAILGGVAVVGLFAVGLIAAMKFNPANKKKDDGAESKNAEKGCGCAKTPKKVVSVKESEYSVNQINPVEVEGQNDIHNAESVTQPQPYMGPQIAHRQNNRPNRNLW